MTRGALLCAPMLALAVACGSPTTTATGLVVDVQSRSLAEVERFTLRTNEGVLLQFRVGRLEAGPGTFPAVHLREHLATGEPVAVAYRDEEGARVAVRLADAPGGER